jgi:hypothetical protein
VPMPTFPTKFFRSHEGPSKDEKRTNRKCTKNMSHFNNTIVTDRS